jgi:hypothetical protein
MAADMGEAHRIVADPGVIVRAADPGRAHFDEHTIGRAPRGWYVEDVRPGADR